MRIMLFHNAHASVWLGLKVFRQIGMMKNVYNMLFSKHIPKPLISGEFASE